MTLRAGIADAGSYIETAQGVVHVVRYYVDGVTGDEITRPVNALNASGLPRMGDPHRAVAGIQVVERTPIQAIDSPTKYFVDIRWAQPTAADANAAAQNRTGDYGPVTWSGNGALTSDETTRDAFGRVMLLDYMGKPEYTRPDINSGNIVASPTAHYFRAIAPVRAERDVGLLEITASRWERRNPERVAATFGGKLNSGGFRSFADRTVLSTTMTFRDDADTGYQVEYSFIFNQSGWQLEEVISVDGSTPIDVRPGNGIHRFQLYPTVNFASAYRL